MKTWTIFILFFSMASIAQSHQVNIEFTENAIKRDPLQLFAISESGQKSEIKNENGAFALPNDPEYKNTYIVKAKNHILQLPAVKSDYKKMEILYLDEKNDNMIVRTQGQGNIMRYYVNFDGGEIIFVNHSQKKIETLRNLTAN